MTPILISPILHFKSLMFPGVTENRTCKYFTSSGYLLNLLLRIPYYKLYISSICSLEEVYTETSHVCAEILS